MGHRHGSLAWEDERRGLQQADPLPFGDVVLWRRMRLRPIIWPPRSTMPPMA
jgi:hypothetical protein